MKGTIVPFRTRMPVSGEVQREFDSLLERFFGGENGGENRGEMTQWFSPQVNLAETEQAYEVTLDLPGVKPEEISLELKQGDLWVTGERKHETEEQEKRFHRVERHYGQFRRVIRLGEDVNPDQIDAEYKDGVLQVTVGKAETAKTRRIEIRS